MDTRRLQVIGSTGKPDVGKIPAADAAGIAAAALTGIRMAWNDPATRAAYEKWRNTCRSEKAERYSP